MGFLWGFLVEITIKFIDVFSSVFCKKKVHSCARIFAEFCHPIVSTYLARDKAFDNL